MARMQEATGAAKRSHPWRLSVPCPAQPGTGPVAHTIMAGLSSPRGTWPAHPWAFGTVCPPTWPPRQGRAGQGSAPPAPAARGDRQRPLQPSDALPGLGGIHSKRKGSWQPRSMATARQGQAAAAPLVLPRPKAAPASGGRLIVHVKDFFIA